MSKGKVRKWKEEYSQFGFTATTVDRVEGRNAFSVMLCFVILIYNCQS